MGKCTWTKRPKYGGLQSTMDSNDNMRELKPSNLHKTPFTHTWRLEKDPVHDVPENGVYDAHSEEFVSVHSEEYQNNMEFLEFDKPWPNLETSAAQQEAGGNPGHPSSPHLLPHDPLMEELDSLLQSSEGEDPTQCISENDLFEGYADTASVGASRGQDEQEPRLLKQPETPPISHDQLVMEVKRIYAGLVLVEAKCIEVDEKQMALAQEKDAAERRPIRDEQWQSLIALHRQLLNEHHDFFLASQHPVASPALRSLASKYAMPTRMWKHGVQGFVDAMLHQPHLHLSDMRSFLQETRATVQELTQIAPDLIDEWTEMMKALDAYEDILGDVAQSVFSVDLNPLGSTLNLEEIMRNDPPDQAEVEFGDWYSFATDWYSIDKDWCFHDPADPSGSCRASLCSTSHRLQMPSYVLEVLAGWLIWGQGVASNSFNIYCKVFIVMSLIAIRYAI